MKRIDIEERPDWRLQCENIGFDCHTIGGERYWDESRAYVFTSTEIDAISAASDELMGMCYEAVSEIVRDGALMERMEIDPDFHDAIAASWDRADKDLYGRFDFAYSGDGPAKLLEFNGDCAGGLFESAVAQRHWLGHAVAAGKVPRGARQFNSLDHALETAFAKIEFQNGVFHFAVDLSMSEHMLAVRYLNDRAKAAGLRPQLIDIADIGVDAHDNFTDTRENVIRNLHVFMQLDEIVESDYGPAFAKTGCRVYEPLWKIVLSNKGLLPVLWDMYPDHPNLLPAYFEDDSRVGTIDGQVVFKPLSGSQGEGVGTAPGGVYEFGGRIAQARHPLSKNGDDHAVLGVFMVAGKASGLGIQEDKSRITGPECRFVPHIVVG